ncbi:GATA transcription factor 8-like [Macadamia integrifolia]|uniref:GATA transcription factor 8-like n=1 Tax=Macadamia integrifolia TaxID=60698 RepID=UPI001C4E2F5B|nr:GATA transcription factor 8-like [Macadamia integrifolia]XP_042513086.1 GATA transcription factor 8-like [Macadamia integrifolia]
MEFRVAYWDMMRKMYLMQMEPMMQMPRELKEQDLISRVGKSENGGDGEVGCYHNLGLLHNNPTVHHPFTVFNGPSPIPPQVGKTHELTIGASAFRSWAPSYNQVTYTANTTTCERVSNSHGLITGGSSFRPWVTPSPYRATRTYKINNRTSGFVNLLGSTSGMASLRRRPRPIIPKLAVKYGELDLSLALSQPIYNKEDPVGNKKTPVRSAKVAVLNTGNGSENGNKACNFCKTNNTPLWRNGPHGRKTLCNACGIRLKKKQKKIMEISTVTLFKPRNVIKKP